MPDVTKLITLGNLQSYDTLIKEYIGEEDAKSLHKVLFDSTNKQIKFYKNADATVSDTADFTIDIPADLDSTATIASVSSGVVTLKAGLSEVDGIVANNSDSDITLAKVATTGAAEDVDYDNTTSGLTATNVQAAIDEVAAQSQGGVGSKTIWVEDESAGQSDYAKVYKIYQCATQAEESSTTLKGTINIPRDLFIKAASVETVVTPDVPYEGAAVGDKYIDIEVQNQQAHLYVPCNSLVDEYTAEQSATQIQLAIDANNVISATIVAGSVTATELASDAVTTAKIADANVTTAKIADDAVTADKVAIAVHTETQTAGADGVSISVSTTDGQVSAVSASIAANTYDAYGTAASTVASAIAGLDSDLDASGTPQHSGVFVVSGVTEVDGVLTAVDSVEVESAGTTATAIAALDSSTSDVTATTGSSLAVLTQVDVTDGLISGATTTTLGSAATHADTDFMASADYTLTTESEIEALFD